MIVIEETVFFMGATPAGALSKSHAPERRQAKPHDLRQILPRRTMRSNRAGPTATARCCTARCTLLRRIAASKFSLTLEWIGKLYEIDTRAADDVEKRGELRRTGKRDHPHPPQGLILALQEKTRAIAHVALGEANQAGGITREELLGLLD
jgi:hypothetical protein